MSHTPPDAPTGSQASSTLLPAFLAAAALSVFVVIVLIARQPAPVDRASGPVDEADAWKTSNEGRKARLAELRGQEATTAATYAWIDQPAGTVRLPLDRAVELTIAELQAGQARP